MSLPEFSRIVPHLALGFDDVVLEPAFSSVSPKDADLKTRLTRNITLERPFIVEISDAEQAIHAAQIGSIGIISHEMAISKQADIVRKVKRSQSRIVRNPVSLVPEMPIVEALEAQQRYGLDIIPVVENGTQVLAGYLVLDDSISYDDPEKSVGSFMSPMPVVTLPDNAELSEAYALMDEQQTDLVALLDVHGKLTGLVTKEDRMKSAQYPHATTDKNGCLSVAATINTEDYLDRVSALIDAGVDVILLDAPHGHSKKITEIITYIRRQRSGHVDVIAGSVVTNEAALALIDSGADAIKLGHQLPMITAALNVAEASSLHNIPVLADHPENETDAAKLFAAGVSTVIMKRSEAVLEEKTHILETSLRHHMSETGCPTIKEFNLRPRFVKIGK